MQGGKRLIKADKVGYANYSSPTPLLMDTAHILQFVDKVLSAKTGKHLNDLQRKITALFRLVRYTTEVGTRQCRVPTAIEEQSGCTS